MSLLLRQLPSTHLVVKQWCRNFPKVRLHVLVRRSLLLLTKKWFLRDILYLTFISGGATARIIVAFVWTFDSSDMTADVQLSGRWLGQARVILRVFSCLLISICLLCSYLLLAPAAVTNLEDHSVHAVDWPIGLALAWKEFFAANGTGYNVADEGVSLR